MIRSALFGRALAREHQRMDDALEGRGNNGCGDAFAGDIRDGDAKAVVESDDIVEIAAYGMAGKTASADFGKIQTGKGNCHQTGVDGSSDCKLFFSLTGFLLCVGEKGIVKERGGLVGEGVEHLMVDFAEVAAADLAVEIEEAQEAIWLGGGDVPAQRDAIDAADGVGHHACPAGGAYVGEGVAQRKLRIAFDGLLHGLARDGGVFVDGGTVSAQAERKAKLSRSRAGIRIRVRSR